VPNICLFLPFLHHFCQCFDSFKIKIGAAEISALFNTTKAPKKWQTMELGKKESNVWHLAKFSTGATFSPELNLSRCYI